MAIAVIGGLLSSMVLSLVFTPAIHYFLQRRHIPAVSAEAETPA